MSCYEAKHMLTKYRHNMAGDCNNVAQICNNNTCGTCTTTASMR